MEYLILYYLISFPIISFISYGYFFAYFQGAFPILSEEDRYFDIGVSIIIGVLVGSLNILGILFMLYITEKMKYGWRLK